MAYDLPGRKLSRDLEAYSEKKPEVMKDSVLRVFELPSGNFS